MSKTRETHDDDTAVIQAEPQTITVSDAIARWPRGARARQHKDKFYREENIRPLSEVLRHFKEGASVEVIGQCNDCGLTTAVKVTPPKESNQTPFVLVVG
jgi:hypothetical protein